MPRYYDRLNNRLVYTGKTASPDFWDEHWSIHEFKPISRESENNPFILENTRRFLKKGRILEGGCGTGGNVYSLHYNGYSAYGVDYAKKTVEKINKYLPELNVSVGDVRSLDFDDGFFDGYWSLGVIEHFYKGYDSILGEMKRVLKKGGYVFLSFPYMSPLRNLKARFGLYKKFDDNINLDDFYQFALDEKKVKEDFEKQGFILKYRKPYDGLKGFKDEVFFVKPILQRLYDYKGDNILVNEIISIFHKTLSPFSAHMIMMVLQKNEKD